MKQFQKLMSSVGAGVLGLAITAQAMAEKAPGEITETQSGGVEDIIVTAQRVEQKLQDVPIAITAFTEHALEAKGITSTIALEQGTPGLAISRQSQALSPYIRGIGTAYASVPGLESPVAFYVDGIYYPQNAGNALSFNNIQRVEVLKGPQGTLFGRNSTGGLISIITRDPSSDERIKGTISYGNYNTIEGNFYATGGRDGLAADLAVYGIHQGDGFGKNITTGNDKDRQRSIALRGKIYWEASPDDVFTLSLDWMRDRSDFGIGVTGAPGSLLIDRKPGERHNDSRSELDNRLKLTSYTAGLRYVHDFTWGTLTSITGYRNVHDRYLWDPDGSPLQLLRVISRTYSRSLQQEFLLSGKANQISWTAGIFLFDAEQGNSPSIRSAIIPAANRQSFGNLETSSYAVYAQGAYAVGPATNITAGFRYTIDRRSLNGRIVALPGNTFPAGTIVETELTDNEKTFKRPSWRLALDHRLGDDVMIYARYDRGFKSGVFNVSALGSAAVNPEQLDAYEIGLKSDLLDRQLRLNLSGFHYIYNGIQLGRVNAAGVVEVINAASAKIDGLEAEAVVAPRFDSISLELSAAFSWLNARYTDFPGGPVNLPSVNGGNVQSSGNLSGNDLTHAPDWTLSLAADLSVPIGDNELGLNALYYHSERFYWEPDNIFKENPYDVVNAQVYFKFGGEKNYRLRLFGKNLLNTHFGTAGFASATGNMYAYGAPRTYGVAFDFEF